MKRFIHGIMAVVLVLMSCGQAQADGRAGVIQFSDGHTVSAQLSLTPGKDLRIFTEAAAVSVPLAEVKEMRFKVEKEEMRQGFYFPNAGQATQAKTSDVYPVRYFSLEIVLADGKAVAGHLMTTVLYAESDAGTQKILLVAKMTGEDGQKLTDLDYPTDIRFDAGAPEAAATQVDLTQASFAPLHPPVIFARPDLALLPASQIAGKQAWTVPAAHPETILFSVEAADGVHVAWPVAEPAAEAEVAPVLKTALAEMHDFFDTRTVLGLAREDDNVYSLVMLKRAGATDSFSAGTIPWSLVAMRWKYDADQKKLTLLNRINLAQGRAKDNSPAPAVLMEPQLLRDIVAEPSP